MSRHSPPWMAEAVAWCATAVLLIGVVAIGSGVIERHPGVPATRVVTGVKPMPIPVQPAARTTEAVRSRAATVALQREPTLGPPPGPIKNIAPARVAAPEDRYALLVGITRYKKPTHDTIAGAKDVRFIRTYLLANGWLPQNIHTITNEKATGAAIRRELKWLVSKSVSGTFTLFHFSGHVKQEGGREKLWPYARDFVTDLELASIISRGKGKAWVDIAGCEAGGFYEKGLASSRVLVTVSSKRTEKSYEHPAWGESVWVGLMWDVGMAQGQADLDRDGVTTVGESIVWASYWAQAVTLRQRPYGRQTPSARGDHIRGWTIANPPA